MTNARPTLDYKEAAPLDMANKRIDHPKPSGAAAQEAIRAAVDALRRAHPLEAEAILQFGAAGLEVGRQDRDTREVERPLREFLALAVKSKLFTKAIPALTNPRPEADGGRAASPSTTSYAQVIDALGRRIAEIKILCEATHAVLESPAHREARRMESEPEVTMAGWAAVGPMAVGDTKAPLSLSTTDLMNLATALGVDGPTEDTKNRKWRWESPSRKRNIQKATDSMRASLGDTRESLLEAMKASLARLPDSEFRRDVAKIFGLPRVPPAMAPSLNSPSAAKTAENARVRRRGK